MAGQGGKNRKLGRNKDKMAKYKASNRRAINKLKRVAHSNGTKAAVEYAKAHNIDPKRIKPRKSKTL